MSTKASGASRASAPSFPLKHISIRIPWHDAGWDGTVCRAPSRNTSCLKLINIAGNKDEAAEEKIAGKSFADLPVDGIPPCAKERGTIMAPFAFTRLHEHPYTRTSPETHSHFRPTQLHYPPYAASALPFRWMMKPQVFGDEKQGIRPLTEQYPLEDVDQGFEPEFERFDTHWVQDHRNHRALLDCFWNHVRTEESLVFFYAKQIPLVEDTGRRILIGVGRVLTVGGMTEYAYQGSPEGRIRSLLWERMVVHSVRPGFKDGFMLPYHEALEKSQGGVNFNPAEVVAFAPEDRFEEFSYATEHVSTDAAIEALLACRASLLRASELFDYSCATQEKWIDEQLGRLWKKRGPFPGIGSILKACGVPMGHFIAQTLVEMAGEDGNPWSAWDKVVKAPEEHLPKALRHSLDYSITKSWTKMSAERRQFLELLSRIDLSDEQAAFLAIPEVRAEQGMRFGDSDFMKNPYLIYEASRLTVTPVSVAAVDRAMFPSAFIRDKHPLPAPSLVKTAVDARRLRALVTRDLELAAQRGDTLRMRSTVIVELRKANSTGERLAEVTADLLSVAEEDQFPGEIQVIKLPDETIAYQLERFHIVGQTIKTAITQRIGAPRHSLPVDWRKELDAILGELPKEALEREKESRAREEKTAALAEISSARFSVLIGPAGTGKTTLLSVLCRRPEIQKDGITLLAPTGKARVRMAAVAKGAGTQNFAASTLAQFLSKSHRYDPETQRYLLTGEPGEKVGGTVIVDECSMLTEEMLAALIESLSGVQRLIFVGDPRQLPPIGAGRPFADVVAHLEPEGIESRFPRVSKSYAALTIPRRQGAGEREDLQLAAWFGGGSVGPGEDQIFEILAGRRKSETIEFVSWETPNDLERLLPEKLATTLKFDPSMKEWQAFACSLGGSLAKEHVYFNWNHAGAAAEAWQILSPVRQQPWGVDSLNRQIHQRYKAEQVATASANVPWFKRRIPKPLGDQQIVYGDKVINNRNQSIYKSMVYPQTGQSGYIANGEIGMVVGQLRTAKFNYDPKLLQVEFSTQAGTLFKFDPKRFNNDENDSKLELAYALTVHKAQGSEFDIVFLVLPRSQIMMSRELLYTALTRQKSKVVILHQGSATDLQRLSDARHSATATRLSNLFGPPKPVQVGNVFLEDRLIHRTSRGDAVRSKSEVIIANLLHGRRIQYHYEQPLELDGVVKYPDFTIENDNTGVTYYWEHCGLLHEPAYYRRWKEKQDWYRANGILPHESGGGPKGTLVVTRDQADGGIDSRAITLLLNSLFGVA